MLNIFKVNFLLNIILFLSCLTTNNYNIQLILNIKEQDSKSNTIRNIEMLKRKNVIHINMYVLL